MQVKGFSCIRPVPDHIGEVLGRASTAPFDGAVISLFLKEQLLVLDISRALYLVAYSTGEHTYQALMGCIENSCAHSDSNTSKTTSTPAAASTSDYQSEPVRVVYPSSMALSIILGAATGAVPLYNIHNDASQLVVWRISRAEALEAIEAAFSTIETTLPELLYQHTMVELVDSTNACMPKLPKGLFSHKN